MAAAMGKVVILGCGYVGKMLARRLVERGCPVRATTTTEAHLSSLGALGAEPRLLQPGAPETWPEALGDAETVIHLAPPAEGRDPGEQARALAAACGPQLKAYVYGSTTGVLGEHPPESWVDEDTAPLSPGARGAARLRFEETLAGAGLPLRIVRIAGIYGPGRTLSDQLRRQSLILFEGGPPTSRIHVADLVRMLEALMEPGAPRLVVACDEEPAPTLEVARYTCELLGLTCPEPVALEDAKRVLSPAALEMRLGGRRCRSRVRPRLIGDLAYPTYREGVKASLIAEGSLRA